MSDHISYLSVDTREVLKDLGLTEDDIVAYAHRDHLDENTLKPIQRPHETCCELSQ